MNKDSGLAKYLRDEEKIAKMLFLLAAASAVLEYFGVEQRLPFHIALLTIAFTPILLKREQMNNMRFAVPYLAAAALIFTMPLFKNFSYWGYHDWDFHMAMNEVARRTIIEYWQIPFWNPFAGGGKIFLANPSSGFLSPLYVIVLIFGTVHGMKLQIIAHTILGLIGFMLLSKNLGLKGHAAYLPGFVYMFNSFYSLHLTVGHYAWIATCWLPYVFLYYKMSYEELRYTLVAGLFIALMYLEAHGYLFAYSLLVIGLHAFFKFATNLLSRQTSLRRKLMPLIIIPLIVSSTLLIGSVKIIPTLLYTQDYPHKFTRQPGFQLSTLEYALLNTSRISTSIYWHNKSAYMGVIPILLALMGVVVMGRESIPLILALIIILWASFTTYAQINIWEMINKLPLYQHLRSPTRLIMLVVFIIAIFAGQGAKKVDRISEKLTALLVTYCMITFVMYNSNVLYKAFIIEPYAVKRTGTEFQQGYFSDKKRGQNTNIFAHINANQGYLKDYDPVKKRNYAIDFRNKSYEGEAFMTSNNKAELTYFSPNKFVVEPGDDGVVVLNQNYVDGWSANGKEALKVDGLVGAEATKEEGEVAFKYTPPGFYLGFMLTTGTLVLTLLALTNNLPKLKQMIKDTLKEARKESEREYLK
ncbi:MAG: hypothetical protein ABIH11_01035 [Candidatus Altiarchaeota archaeon]